MLFSLYDIIIINNLFNCLQIVNDALVFFRGEDLAPEVAFNVIAFLRGETDYYVWAAALGQLEWIRRRFDHIPDLQEEYEVRF